MSEYTKHPDATIDVRCSFLADLQAGETVMQVRWVAFGLTIVAEQIIADSTVAVAWVAGGFHKGVYRPTCAALTNRGRTIMREVVLHVNDNAPLPESSL